MFMDRKTILLSVLPKAIYSFNAIPIKITVFFCRNKKIHPKVHIDSQGAPNSQNSLEKEQGLGLTLFDFKAIIKTVWY